MSLSKLLVTGGEGLLGSAVIDAARDHYNCVSTDVKSGDSQGQFVALDLCNYEAVRTVMNSVRPRYVVHCGAISHPLRASRDPVETIGLNTVATANLLDIAHRIGVDGFVFISSAAVYEGICGLELVNESAALAPRSIYAASKVAAEAIVQGYVGAFHFPAVILRPCSIYGAKRRTFSAPSFLVASALDGVNSELVDGGYGLDFVHVEDAARAVLLALGAQEATGKTFNIATGVQVTYPLLAASVRRIIPGAQIFISAGDADLGPEPRLDVSRARMDLGFTCKFGLDEGLAELVDSFISAPYLKGIARLGALNSGCKPFNLTGPLKAV